MAIEMEEAREAVESVFDFDHVADAMFALRRDLNSAEARTNLVCELVKCAAGELEDDSPECAEILTEAATARVEQFVKGSKYSQSGCSGL